MGTTGVLENSSVTGPRGHERGKLHVLFTQRRAEGSENRVDGKVPNILNTPFTFENLPPSDMPDAIDKSGRAKTV